MTHYCIFLDFLSCQDKSCAKTLRPFRANSRYCMLSVGIIHCALSIYTRAGALSIPENKNILFISLQWESNSQPSRLQSHTMPRQHRFKLCEIEFYCRTFIKKFFAGNDNSSWNWLGEGRVRTTADTESNLRPHGDQAARHEAESTIISVIYSTKIIS